MKHRSNLWTRTLYGAGSLAVTLLISACSDSGSVVVTNPENGEAETPVLARINDEAEFTRSIKAALRNHQSSRFGSGTDGGGDTGGTDGALSLPDAVNAPQASVESSDSSASDSGTSDSFTGTNVQEIGVDEQDRVKTDGSHLFVLVAGGYSDVFPTEPEILPVVDLPVDLAVTSRLSIPRYPDTRAQLRILSLDSETPDATVVAEMNLDFANENVGGLYLYGADSDQSVVLTSSSLNGYWGYWGEPSSFGGSTSSIRKIAVGDAANPEITDTLKLDGQLVSSRRVDNYLYVATRYYPTFAYDGPEPFDTALEEVSVDELLPKAVRESDQQISEMASARNCFVAAKPQSGYYSPDLITLAVINLDDLSVSDSVCFLGATETLYASPNAAYLATTDYNFATFDGDTVVLVDPDDTDTTSIDRAPTTTTTSIHQFDFEGGGLVYRGSGKVRGHLGWNEDQKPFRMSEREGYLRIATFNDSGNGSPVFVSVMQPADGNTLDVIATLPNERYPAHIGKPGERLHASRFLGDKGYLVTFRQTDPLYVVDFSEPANPFIAGELEIEGYSDYLHPVGPNHLLGYGKGAIADTRGFGDWDRGAFYQGVKISLFDISDASNPTEVQALEIGGRGTESNALWDHHAFTYMHGRDGAPGRLAVSIDLADIPTSDAGEPWSFYNWRESGLNLFEVRTDANAGIAPAGRMIVEATTTAKPWPSNSRNDRSIIVNDAVYYIRDNVVYAANWNSIGNFVGPR